MVDIIGFKVVLFFAKLDKSKWSLEAYFEEIMGVSIRLIEFLLELYPELSLALLGS